MVSSDDCVVYRQHGQPINTGMGVVIQKMVNAEQAGALFTYDPVTDDCSTVVINANYVGESVVSGQTEPVTFKVTRIRDSYDETTMIIRERLVGSKQVQYLVSESGDVRKQHAVESSSLCIDDKTVLTLCQIGLEIEQSFGYPCDIEWATSGGEIYLLQSRPITTLNQPSEYELLHEFDSPLVRDDEHVSTMNIGEVIPGALCPLTLSVVIPRLDGAMQLLFAGNGLNYTPSVSRVVKIFSNQAFLNVHVSEIVHKGRNLLTERKMMELTMAGHTLDRMNEEEVESYNHSVPLTQRLRNTLNFFSLLIGADARCKAHAADVDSLSLPDTTDCTEILVYIEKTLTTLKQVFIDDVPAAGGSGALSQIIMAVLTKRATVWENKHYSDLATLMGCQLNEVFSVGVPEQLEALAALIADCPELAKELCDRPASQGHDLLTSELTPEAISSAYQNFIERFGHRGRREMDLMEKSWAQHPAEVIETLQLMVRNSSTRHQMSTQTSSVDDVINNLKSEVSAIAKMFIKYLLPRTKRAVNDREVCKSLLVKSVYKAKLAYWRLAELMHIQGFLPSPELLLFLTHTELVKVLNSRSGRIVSRAKRRFRIYEKQTSIKFPRFSDGIPQPLVPDAGLPRSPEVELELKGMPVSIGEVTGTARVVKSIAEAYTIKKNDVMIVNHTDVGWAPFFPLISGVVTEQGGLVSHGAVVAREYGIPCIVSCHGATDVFQSDDLVCLNGSTGVIRLLRKEDS